ncbi:MAG TPA: creatininase family protein [Vicinamibacterales bacterium]|nr:creatininase family protein [Vicinamibacterales bacterium]
MRQAIARFGVACVVAIAMAAAQGQQPQPARQPARPPGAALADVTWPEAEKLLTPAAVVVLPVGAGAVQQGPHLRLNSEERLVRHLAGRVQAAASVVIAPPLTYHFYPAFLEYPGSTSLSQNTSRDMTVEIVRTLAKYGPRRFYVLNTGASTMFPLKDAADTLAADGILLGYTDMRYHLGAARVLRRQARARGGFHADEAMTSMMLAVDAPSVDMARAVREYGAGSGALTRQKDGAGLYSTSGVVGDPTLASSEQGQLYLDALVAGAIEDIESIRTARLPIARPAATAAPLAARPQPQRPVEERMPNGCTAGEERTIRGVGERFSYLWRQLDAEAISRLFTADGDMRHPDGTIERGQQVLFQNRLELFRNRDYRGSNHPVQLTDVRCLPGGAAIADGKWELRFDQTPSAASQRRGLGPNRLHAGWCTLVLVRADSTWQIQAWRYTINPPDGEPAPTTLTQPGFLPRRGGGGH